MSRTLRHAARHHEVGDEDLHGFTLNDLVSYDHKHNAANGEDNRSWNCGVLTTSSFERQPKLGMTASALGTLVRA